MTFDEMLQTVRELLEQDGRVAYRVLKRRFAFTEEDIEDIKSDLIDAKQFAYDEDDKVLCLAGEASELQPPAETPVEEADRRLLTVMFCDIVDSTALSESFEAEELRDVIQEYQQLCSDVIERYNGHVAQYLGDGLLVYFGYPVAQEDEAFQAVSSGLEIMETLDKAGHFQARIGMPLRVRIGINTGPVVIGEMGARGRHERLALGDTPNIAARVQSAARPSELLISHSTNRLVEGLFEVESLGEQDLKGISKALNLYRVVGEGSGRSRFEVALSTGNLADFVGRQDEMTILDQRWQSAIGKKGQVVLLTGEPGMGKSRLAQEFKERIAAEDNRQMVFRCSPYHQSSPFYPVTQVLERVFQFDSSDSATQKIHKVDEVLKSYGVVDSDAVGLICGMLSVTHPGLDPNRDTDPLAQRHRLFQILIEWMVEEARRKPLYVIWDDIHWADPSTLELLDYLVERVPSSTIFALLIYRSDYTLSWANRSYIEKLVLNRLDDNDVEELVEYVAGDSVISTEVLSHIKEKTDGIPLFVEELTRALLDSDHPIGDVESQQIPATLQDLLEARLDSCRFGKEIAQWGATIGREFSYAVLRAVVADDQKVKNGINELLDAELIYRSGSASEPRFIFKHALLRDTAYESLLLRTRREYHARIAKILESDFPQYDETLPEVIAGHYTEGGLVDDAVRYWHRAGRYALERSADQEAKGHLSRGLELLSKQGRTPARARLELDLQLLLGPLLIGSLGNASPEVEKTYRRALEVCDEIDEPGSKVPVYFGLRSHYLSKADLESAHNISIALLQATGSGEDEDALLEAHVALCNSYFFLGNNDKCAEHAKAASKVFNKDDHQSHASIYGLDPGINALVREAQTAWQCGNITESEKLSARLFALCEETPHPLTRAFALINMGTLAHWARDAEVTVALTREALDIATENGYPFYRAWAMVQLGGGLASQGEVQAGVAEIEQGMGILEAVRQHLIYPWFATLYAEALGFADEPERGLAILPDAAASMERTNARYCEAYYYCTKGRLLSQAKLMTEAEKAYLRAIETATRSGAKALSLRAHVGLASLTGNTDIAMYCSRLKQLLDSYATQPDSLDVSDGRALLAAM